MINSLRQLQSEASRFATPSGSQLFDMCADRPLPGPGMARPQDWPNEASTCDGVAGIYAFLSEQLELIYIGESVDLQTRIRQHLARTGQSGGWSPRPRFLAVFHVQDKSRRGSLERHLIETLDPVENRQCRMRRDALGAATVTKAVRLQMPTSVKTDLDLLAKAEQSTLAEVIERALSSYIRTLPATVLHAIDGMKAASADLAKRRSP